MTIVRRDDNTLLPGSEPNPPGWLCVTISQIGGGQALSVDFASWASFRQYVERSDPAFGGWYFATASSPATHL